VPIYTDGWICSGLQLTVKVAHVQVSEALPLKLALRIGGVAKKLAVVPVAGTESSEQATFALEIQDTVLQLKAYRHVAYRSVSMSSERDVPKVYASELVSLVNIYNGRSWTHRLALSDSGADIGVLEVLLSVSEQDQGLCPLSTSSSSCLLQISIDACRVDSSITFSHMCSLMIYVCDRLLLADSNASPNGAGGVVSDSCVRQASKVASRDRLPSSPLSEYRVNTFRITSKVNQINRCFEVPILEKALAAGLILYVTSSFESTNGHDADVTQCLNLSGSIPVISSKRDSHLKQQSLFLVPLFSDTGDQPAVLQVSIAHGT
jgi:hypothetical protein